MMSSSFYSLSCFIRSFFEDNFTDNSASFWRKTHMHNLKNDKLKLELMILLYHTILMELSINCDKYSF